MKIVDNDNVKGMIDVIHQHEVLSSIELYANIELHMLPTLIPQPIPHEPYYYSYPQSNFAYVSDATPSYTHVNFYQPTLDLTQPQVHEWQPTTSSFTQLFSTPFSTNLLASQSFGLV